MLQVDTTSGKRVTRMIPKLTPAEARLRTMPGGDLKVVKTVPKPQPKQPKRPGVVRRAANYGKAVVQHKLAGNPKASLPTIQKRFEICRNCPSGLFKRLEGNEIPHSLRELPIVGTCVHKTCGCFLHPTEIEPAKLAWADQVCPKGHWGKAIVV